uniref:Uncharacterized protein n=1 Tax=Sphaerodactylus townsendi TaxID=933632 RepID=A0ACB8E6F6_9SAUR
MQGNEDDGTKAKPCVVPSCAQGKARQRVEPPQGVTHKQKTSALVTRGTLHAQSSKETNQGLNSDRIRKKTSRDELPVNGIIDVDGIAPEDDLERSCDESEGSLSFEGYMSELKSCQGRMRTGVYRTSELPSLIAVKSEKNKDDEKRYKATFV